jgi:hypothetical protein
MSGADIYVEAEVNENHSNSGNSVNLRLNAYKLPQETLFLIR